MSAIRTLARGVAKNRMKEAGYQQFCKHGQSGKGSVDSVFSKVWRKVVGWDGTGISKT